MTQVIEDGYYLDWKWEPLRTYTIRRRGPATAQIEFEDGVEVRVGVVGAKTKRIFVEEHSCSREIAREMMEVFRDKGMSAPLRKLSFDALDPAETPIDVYFNAEPSIVRDGTRFRVTTEFVEKLT